jgi:DNA polymerase-3 subunit epsilon
VSHAPCANELHALVLESTEIRRLWPRYNYSQKKPSQRFGLYSYEDHKGYIRLLIDKKKKNVPALYEFNLLHEGLVMIRKMADAFELHDKLCFIDKTPITAEEAAILPPVDIYNDRVKAAMKALAEKLQTFAVIDDAPDPSQK